MQAAVAAAAAMKMAGATAEVETAGGAAERVEEAAVRAAAAQRSRAVAAEVRAGVAAQVAPTVVVAQGDGTAKCEDSEGGRLRVAGACNYRPSEGERPEADGMAVH